MAKRKIVLTEPNRLNLTPGKLSIDLDDIPAPKLDSTNSYYDPKAKRRVPLLDFINKEKQITPKELKIKVKVEDEMVNNTDVKVEGKLHSSDFLPPFICTRLWTLSRGTDIGWGWYLRTVDGYKNRYEYYCRPIETEDAQYLRGGDMFTYAYTKFDFEELFVPELHQDVYLKLKKEFKESEVESIQVVVDAMIIKDFKSITSTLLY